MTTLEAVREILQRCGRGTVPSLDTGGSSDASHAERLLDSEALAVHADGWHFNTRYKIDLEPVLYSFDNGSWTAATRTLSEPGAFADAQAGQTITLDQAAGQEVGGDVVVESVTSDDAVVLAISINTDDIDGDFVEGIGGVAKNNAIAVPSGTISIDTDDVDFYKNFTQRGGRLYDLENNTDMFTDGVRVMVIERLSFGCSPYSIRRWIMLRAAQRFSTEMLRGYNLRSIEVDLIRAEADAKRFNNRAEDVNVLDSTAAYRARGGRPRGGSW